MSVDENIVSNLKHEQDAAPNTPGKILRQARETLSIPLTQIAEKMRMSVQFVKELEADDYHRVSTSTYIRGYLRSFAHLVGVNEEKVLRAFDGMEINKELRQHEQIPTQFKDYFILPVYRHQVSLKKRILPWVSLVILFILIALVVMWWQGQGHHLHSQLDSLTKGRFQSLVTPATPGSQTSAALTPENAARAAQSNMPTTPVNQGNNSIPAQTNPASPPAIQENNAAPATQNNPTSTPAPQNNNSTSGSQNSSALPIAPNNSANPLPQSQSENSSPAVQDNSLATAPSATQSSADNSQTAQIPSDINNTTLSNVNPNLNQEQQIRRARQSLRRYHARRHHHRSHWASRSSYNLAPLNYNVEPKQQVVSIPNQRTF